MPPSVPWPRGAASGLFALTLTVIQAHIYVLQQPGVFPSVPYWALVLWLPVQVALLGLITWMALRPVAPPSSSAPSSRA